MAVSSDRLNLSVAAVISEAGDLYATGEWVQAEELCRAVLGADTDCFEALNLLGMITGQTGRSGEAAELLRRAAGARPGDASVAINCGNALTDVRRFDEALGCYDRALEVDPQCPEAHCNRGNALRALGRLEEALASYERALAIKPDLAAACYNRGNALRELNRFDEALASYDRALELNPEYAQACNNRGLTLRALGRVTEALSSYDRALALSPRSVEAWFNHGNALRRLGRFDAALASYERALEIKPDHPWLRGSWLHAKMQLCEWGDLDAQLARLLAEVREGQQAVAPFTLLALLDSPALQRQAAETWMKATCPPDAALPVPRPRRSGARIRIGYYSADYHDHATARLAAGLFEAHDRERFEVVAFSFGPDVTDDMRQRLVRAFDRFIDVRTKSDREVAQLSRDLEIDIAVDLKGFTEDARPGIFACRAAPLQVSYLGYPGTLCAPYIDYLVGDPTVIPPAARAWYAEKVVYLPESYQVNDRRRQIADRSFKREELGLPRESFVFCCFNSAHKITPRTFDSWMRILTRTPGSVLWLLQDNEIAAANLRRAAAARGVSAARLIFAPRCPMPEHLARQRVADLFLDTLPYNAHTTASDALWTGVPVLTQMGESFASRVAASLLTAAGLPELIASTTEEYEELAVGLAGDPHRLTGIRERLERHRLTAPLFDTKAFTGHLETAYQAMYARHVDSGAVQAHCDHGDALARGNRFEEALASYQLALDIRPDHAAAWYRRGNALHELKRTQDSLASYERALAIQPDFAEAWNDRGVVLRTLDRLTEALASYERAIEIKADYAEAHYNRGNALRDLGRPREALASYERALEIRPELADACVNRGNILQDLGHFAEALSSYERALALRPDSAASHNNRGNALRHLKRFDEALASYARALEIKPDDPCVRSSWLHTRMQLCEWHDLDSYLTQLLDEIRQGRAAGRPFTVVGLVDSPALQREAATAWVRDACPESRALPGIDKRARHERIRLGYFSADFHNHATAYLAAELFELHDRARFEVVAFSYGPTTQDEMRQRLLKAFDRFVDVAARSDREIAELSRDLRIDIAVDLKGFTAGGRTGIFSFRAAPVQVSYLGYPGTMGAAYFDYLIADRTLIPPQSLQHYAEQVVYLPHSYQVNDRKRQIADRVFSRAELGLPADGFVFCCFNNTSKITPQIFDGWMRILSRVPGSVLWLLAESPTAQANLRREAKARGVGDERLIFAPRWPLPEHLARQRTAGLFLDTLPYNAHTTASDALWAGLPVLTRMGESFAGRVAASLLGAVGLPELITTTREQYEELAIELARSAERLKAVREQLHRNRLQAPLFHTPLCTRHLEIAYGQIYERYLAGLSPEGLCIAAQ